MNVAKVAQDVPCPATEAETLGEFRYENKVHGVVWHWLASGVSRVSSLHVALPGMPRYEVFEFAAKLALIAMAPIEPTLVANHK